MSFIMHIIRSTITYNTVTYNSDSLYLHDMASVDVERSPLLITDTGGCNDVSITVDTHMSQILIP